MGSNRQPDQQTFDASRDFQDADGRWFSSGKALENAFGTIYTQVELDYGETQYVGLLEDYHKVLEDRHVEYFAGEQSPDGEPWAKLSPVTIRLKGHDQILFEFGDLQDSLTTSHANAIREVEELPGGAGAVFGTADERARDLHFGNPSRNLPARPHVGMSEEDVDDLANRVADEAVEALINSQWGDWP